jgi:hypothetical protein
MMQCTAKRSYFHFVHGINVPNNCTGPSTNPMCGCVLLLVRKFCHICVCRIKGAGSRVIREGWGQLGWKMGQLTCSMELEWSEVRILSTKATIPRKGFFFNLKPYRYTFIFCISYTFVLILYIFLLCRLKINLFRELCI